MKTTFDLDDALFIEIKSLAARRKTTLKAIVEHALRREIRPVAPVNPDPKKYEVGPFGILSLKRSGRKISAKEIQHTIARQYDEEDARAIHIATAKS